MTVFRASRRTLAISLLLPMIFGNILSGSARGQQHDLPVNVAEQYLQSAADEERAAFHLPPLRRDSALAEAARGHARQMLSHGSISHQFENEPELAARGAAAGAKFSLISENVAVSSNVVKIHSAWMRSEGHRHNLLDPNVDAVGIAVIARGNRLFAVEDFERSLVALTLQEQEDAVAKAIAINGIVVKEGDASARRVCADDTASDRQAGFMMRYTTAQLESVPKQLRSRMETGRYGSAVVAACKEESSSDFSMYRIAVLLYR